MNTNRFLRYLFLALLTPALILGIYISYLWATYISEEIYHGEKYGFKINSSKAQTYADILDAKQKWPDLFVYVQHGERAGDFITFQPVSSDFERLNKYDQWDLLIDGENQFFNVIKITFYNESVFKIYRHRQYFELP